MNNIFLELKNYPPMQIIKMGLSFIWTKLFFPGANLIRKPLYFRGKKRNFKFGDGFTSGRACRIELFEDGIIRCGENCHIGDYVHIVASERVEIGDNCLFASKIFISDTSHGEYGAAVSSKESENFSSPNIPPNHRPLVSTPVKIGSNVWIGENVAVLPGVSIGDGCVIGANAVVTKDIPDNTIAVGIPAIVIMHFNETTQTWDRV